MRWWLPWSCLLTSFNHQNLTIKTRWLAAHPSSRRGRPGAAASQKQAQRWTSMRVHGPAVQHAQDQEEPGWWLMLDLEDGPSLNDACGTDERQSSKSDGKDEMAGYWPIFSSWTTWSSSASTMAIYGMLTPLQW